MTIKGRAKIVIIEDLRDVRDVLCIFLSKKGFEVFPAADGSQGLALVKKLAPDLVLIDFKIPVLNGIDVLKKIRTFDKNVKIVMISGSESEVLQEEAAAAGASGFLSKAQDLEVILQRIGKFLDLPA